jgi:hypothetical protein
VGVNLEGAADEFGLEKVSTGVSMNKKRKLNEISNAYGLQNGSRGIGAAKPALLRHDQSEDIIESQKDSTISLTSKRVIGHAPESGASMQRSANPFLQPKTDTKPLPAASISNPATSSRRPDLLGQRKKAPLAGSLLGNKNKELFQQHAKEMRE